MKKLSLYVFLVLMFCSTGYASNEEEVKKKTLERNTKYIGYLEGCSKSNVVHYILKNEKMPPWHELDIFESTNLNLDCLEKKFEQHLDETIIRKQDTVSNGITFKMIEIASLFSEQCGERCRPSSEIILIHKGRYWYMKGSNDRGGRNNFIDNNGCDCFNFRYLVMEIIAKHLFK